MGVGELPSWIHLYSHHLDTFTCMISFGRSGLSLGLTEVSILHSVSVTGSAVERCDHRRHFVEVKFEGFLVKELWRCNINTVSIMWQILFATTPNLIFHRLRQGQTAYSRGRDTIKVLRLGSKIASETYVIVMVRSQNSRTKMALKMASNGDDVEQKWHWRNESPAADVEGSEMVELKMSLSVKWVILYAPTHVHLCLLRRSNDSHCIRPLTPASSDTTTSTTLQSTQMTQHVITPAAAGQG